MDKVKKFREYTRELECHLDNINHNDCCTCNVNKSECFLIVEIGRQPGICIKDLAQILKLDKSGVSRSVEELVKKGYILRQPSEKDRRSVVLTLTESGEERYNKIEADMYTEFKKVFSKIKKSDQDKVLEALRIYNEACRMVEED
ncbi:MAG: MarR family transcriptional regulator [Eubacterium sp.]|nr:MarR family transcriptional regulator [Eubacterium sp.]